MLHLNLLRSTAAVILVGYLCGLSVGRADSVADLKIQLTDLQEDQAILAQQEKALLERIAVLQGEEMAGPTEKTPQGRGDWKTSAHLLYYWDTREYTTFSLMTHTTGLPLGFNVWGFVDINGDQEAGDSDLTRYFLEYRLSRDLDPDWVAGIRGLGVQAEYNDATGTDNNLVRFGLTFRHVLPQLFGKKGWLQWRGFPYETDGSGQQVSLVYYLPLSERAWISGFADYNLREGLSDVWVIEPQLNLKLDDRFALLAEYRFNGFEDANDELDGEGVAFGLSMRF